MKRTKHSEDQREFFSTVTSKLQLTIPIVLARRLGLRRGDKVLVEEENHRIILTVVRHELESLAGALGSTREQRKERRSG